MSDTADLLAELATLDEVSAWIPSVADHDQGITPPWCELVLEINREPSDEAGGDFPLDARLPLRRHDGELIMEVMHDVLHPNIESTVNMIWSELDDVVDRIQARVAKGKDPFKMDVGMARGLTLALAIMARPHAYDVDAIKDAAMERWEVRNQ